MQNDEIDNAYLDKLTSESCFCLCCNMLLSCEFFQFQEDHEEALLWMEAFELPGIAHVCHWKPTASTSS